MYDVGHTRLRPGIVDFRSPPGGQETTMDRPRQPSNDVPVGEPPFFPTGAILFFVALIGFFAVIWLGLYALMIHRR